MSSEYLTQRRNDSLMTINSALAKRQNFSLMESSESVYGKGTITWQTEILIEKQEWKIHVILGKNFPDEPPQIVSPDAKDLFLNCPHVEEEGKLCILPNSAAIDTSRPVYLIDYMIGKAEQILEGLKGSDFQDEFTSYWNRKKTGPGVDLVLLDPPSALPDRLFCFQNGNSLLISASEKTISDWQEKSTSIKKTNESKRQCILICFEEPLLPSEYPETSSDLLKLLLSRSKKNEYIMVRNHICKSTEKGLALLIQTTKNGKTLGGISFNGLNLSEYADIKGFRKGKAPVNIVVRECASILNSDRVGRHSVSRVDHDWIHSRGGDGNSYQNKSVLIIGCGSLGGYVAHLLSRAGVSKLTLLDNDRLEWANLGRHVLGADSVSKWKANALAEHLRKQMPHLDIHGIPLDWRDALRKDECLFDSCDLVISTVADWTCEKPLNFLSRVSKEVPTVLYGWLEPYAVAGHCLVSVNHSGCLACGMNEFGQFQDCVGVFSTGTLAREPGGCTHYQQYGPTSLIPAASVIVSTALKCLNKMPTTSSLESWISDEDHFFQVNSEVSPSWVARLRDGSYSSRYSKLWDSIQNCKICQQIKKK